MGVCLVHHPLHNFSPEVGGGRLYGNGHLQGTLQYCCRGFCLSHTDPEHFLWWTLHHYTDGPVLHLHWFDLQ